MTTNPETLPARAAEIARGLSEAQREAVASAQFCEARGVWNPAGYYVSAHKRVRYNLVRRDLIRDYVRISNRLTPLGLAVRDHLNGEKS